MQKRKRIFGALVTVVALAGCATTNVGNGRYLQIYRSGLLAVEFDMLSNQGCQEMTKSVLRQTKGQQTDARVNCTNESLGSTLPVAATFSHADEPMQIKVRMLSLVACKAQAEKTTKNDPKARITCEVDNKKL